MTGHNDITGDTLISKTNTKEYEENYDKIFGKFPTLADTMETHDWIPGKGWQLKETNEDTTA